MIKTARFIETIGDESFRNFLNQPFKIDILYPVYGDNSSETLLYGWRGKDMGGWYKFTDEMGNVLEFYPATFKIKKYRDVVVYELPFPLTLNMFIEDMYRFGINLFWSKWVDENFEPKQYLNKNDIKKYWIQLLEKIEKSHELI
ncbi:MAG: hypothetical protein ACOC22_00085 [bacterium]